MPRPGALGCAYHTFFDFATALPLVADVSVSRWGQDLCGLTTHFVLTPGGNMLHNDTSFNNIIHQ